MIRCYRAALDVGGEYAYRIRGESHVDARRRRHLQHAVRGNLPEKYREFARQVNEQTSG
jgi:glutamate synthase (NADPH/NADH) large chain